MARRPSRLHNVRSTMTPTTSTATDTRVYNDCPAGMDLRGVLADSDQHLLRAAYEESTSLMAGALRESLALKKVFWINLWQRSSPEERIALQNIDAVDAFSRTLADQVYGAGEAEFDGYGWIINPTGSRMQDWHVDYTNDYSTIFIPLSPLAECNSLQYAVLPPDLPAELYARATADLDRVDLDLLYRESEWVSIRQLIARPFSVLKMDFGAIHRGIANTGSYDRVMFCISVKRGHDLLPPEPTLQRIVV